MATIVEFEGKRTQHMTVFVASTAVLIGDVVLDRGERGTALPCGRSDYPDRQG